MTRGKIEECCGELEFFSHRQSNRRITVGEAFETIETWRAEPGNYLAFIRNDGTCVQFTLVGTNWEITFPGRPELGEYMNCSIERLTQFFSLFSSSKQWHWLFRETKPAEGEII